MYGTQLKLLSRHAIKVPQLIIT